MNRFVASVFVFVSVVVSLPLAAQNAATQLCVAKTQVSSENNADPVGRDQLMKFLNKEKKGPAVEKKQLESAMPDAALIEAKQNNCDYLLTTNRVDTHTEQSVIAVGGMGRANVQNTSVTVAYKLMKVSDGSEASSGTFKASGEGGEDNAMGIVMKKVADKTSDALKKAGPSK